MPAPMSPVSPIQEGGKAVGARLCLFGNNSSDLLEEHKHWITSYFVPKLRANPHCWMDLIGHSSPSGSAARNQELSKSRMDAVEAFIKGLHSGVKVNVKRANGSSGANMTGIRNGEGYWRAVTIYWFGITDQVMVPAYVHKMPDWLKRVYKLVPQMDTWRAAAVRVLDTAKGGVGLAAPNEEQRQAMALVDRVFTMTGDPGQTNDQSRADLERSRRCSPIWAC